MNLLPDLRRERWMDRAACKGVPGGLFDATTVEEAGPALAYCARCPVKADCAEYATRHGESGVWGGRVFDGGKPDDRASICTICGETFIRNRKSLRRHCYTCRARYGSRPCGTSAAHRRHRRHGEPACDECKAAERRRKKERQCHT